MRRFFMLFLTFFILSFLVAVLLEGYVWKDKPVNMEFIRTKAMVQAVVAFVWAAIMSAMSKKKAEK